VLSQTPGSRSNREDPRNFLRDRSRSQPIKARGFVAPTMDISENAENADNVSHQQNDLQVSHTPDCHVAHAVLKRGETWREDFRVDDKRVKRCAYNVQRMRCKAGQLN
jgi:hypothetical protein